MDFQKREKKYWHIFLKDLQCKYGNIFFRRIIVGNSMLSLLFPLPFHAFALTDEPSRLGPLSADPTQPTSQPNQSLPLCMAHTYTSRKKEEGKDFLLLPEQQQLTYTTYGRAVCACSPSWNSWEVKVKTKEEEGKKEANAAAAKKRRRIVVIFLGLRCAFAKVRCVFWIKKVCLWLEFGEESGACAPR